MISSPSAPDQFTTSAWWLGTEIRVGDPVETISNRHRYQLEYVHPALRSPALGTTPHVAWNAVGDGWAVAVSDIEIHLTADRELLNPTCDAGGLGSTGGCTIEVVAPGHLIVNYDKVDPGQFVTVRATFGAATAVTLPMTPTGPAPDPGSGWSTPLLLAAIVALVGGAAMSPALRRLGREIIWEGGAADAAFGPAAQDDRPTRRVDFSELQELSTIEFEPPRDLSASLGGVVHLGRVHNDHKTAWLLEAAIREEIVLDPSEDAPTIQRGPAAANPAVAGVLNTMFGGSTTIALDKYNPTFAAGWTSLGTGLDQWRKESGFWDERGDRRRGRALGFGWLLFILGLAGVGASAAFANRTGSAWFIPLGIAAAVAGTAIAAIIRSWELRVRSAAGSGAWIRIESFRRFLHESEAEHVERAAEVGLLRQYTAWAVALGEVDRWEKATKAAAAGGTQVDTNALRFAATSYVIASAVRTASTAPSSSGGGGGGAGGGGGGGGGGSW